MSNETTPQSELNSQLRNAVFSLSLTDNQSNLSFSPRVQRFFDGGMHTPLQQLSFLQSWGSLIPPSELEVKRQWYNPKPRLQDGLAIYPSLTGFPSDIFMSIENEPTLLSQVTDKINHASNAVLLGVISIRSVIDTATYLKEKGFKGRLTVYDIQEAPLEIDRIYQEFGLLPKEITFEFVQQDVLKIEKDTSADLIISDVLGYYLTPEQYQTLGNVISRMLKQHGLWITRELVEPNGPPEPEERDASGKRESDPINPFNQYIEKLFGFKLDTKIIDEFEKTKWVIVPTYTRKSLDEYTSSIPIELKMLGLIPITTVKQIESENPRIFNSVVYRKN